jgi:hypothetical protein
VKKAANPPRWLGVLGASCVAILGIVYLIALFVKRHPTIGPDEFGFLMNGQRLIGNAEVPLTESMRSFYMVGYSYVTAAAALIGGNMRAEFTISLIFNMFFVFFTGVLVKKFSQRHLGLSREWSIGIAIAVCMMPTIAANALFSFSESLSRLCFTLLVFLVFEYARGPRLLIGALLGLLTPLMTVIHGRFILVLPLVLLVLLCALITDLKSRFRTVAVSALVLVVALYVMRLSNFWLRDDLYPEARGQEGRVIGKFLDPNNVSAIIRATGSQGWYLLATTFGISLFGLAMFVMMMKKNLAHFRQLNWLGPVFAISASFAVLFTSSLQLILILRPDHLAYGRYSEVVTPLFFASGMSFVLTHKELFKRWWWVGLASIAGLCAFFIVGSGGDNLRIRMARGEYFEIGNGIGLAIPKKILEPMGYISTTLLFVAIGILLTRILVKNAALGLAGVMLLSVACSSYTIAELIVPRRSSSQELTLDDLVKRNAREPSETLIGFDIDAADIHKYFDYRYLVHPVQVSRLDVYYDIPSDRKCVIGMEERPLRGKWLIEGREESLGLVLWKRQGVDSC